MPLPYQCSTLASELRGLRKKRTLTLLIKRSIDRKRTRTRTVYYPCPYTLVVYASTINSISYSLISNLQLQSQVSSKTQIVTPTDNSLCFLCCETQTRTENVLISGGVVTLTTISHIAIFTRVLFAMLSSHFKTYLVDIFLSLL